MMMMIKDDAKEEQKHASVLPIRKKATGLDHRIQSGAEDKEHYIAMSSLTTLPGSSGKLLRRIRTY